MYRLIIDMSTVSDIFDYVLLLRAELIKKDQVIENLQNQLRNKDINEE